MSTFRIRNTMLNDWESMCQLAFRARWFGTKEEKDLMDISDRQPIRWGSYFEQLVLGSGVGGKRIDLTEREYASDFYKRVKAQAETARGFIFEELAKRGFPHVEAQVQLITDFYIDGEIVPYEGNADSVHGEKGKPTLILDTKNTADTASTWGKYSWGNPHAMDMGQLVGYSSAAHNIYNHLPESMYYVADMTEKLKVEVIHVEFSEVYRQEYMFRLVTGYRGIREAVAYNHWVPRPSFNECSSCPLKNTCSAAVKIPDITSIIK